MTRIFSYLVTALVAGVVGAQLATPDVLPRARRVEALPQPRRESRVAESATTPVAREAEPGPTSAPRAEPTPAEDRAAQAAQAKSEKRSVVSIDEAARAGYLELVRRNTTRTYDEEGRRLVITVEPFVGADQRLAGALGNSWLGTRSVTIELERAESGKVRVLDPDRGRREGLRLWIDLEFEEEKLPSYLAPYRAYVPR